jgi:hypothetical protein
MVATMDACAVSGGDPPPEPGGYGLRVGMADCKWPGRVCRVTRSSPAPARAPGPRPSHSGGVALVSSHRQARCHSGTVASGVRNSDLAGPSACDKQSPFT